MSAYLSPQSYCAMHHVVHLVVTELYLQDSFKPLVSIPPNARYWSDLIHPPFLCTSYCLSNALSSRSITVSLTVSLPFSPPHTSHTVSLMLSSHPRGTVAVSLTASLLSQLV